MDDSQIIFSCLMARAKKTYNNVKIVRKYENVPMSKSQKEFETEAYFVIQKLVAEVIDKVDRLEVD